MIVKRINKDNFKGKDINGLLSYIEHGEGDDKCLNFSYINSITNTDSELNALLGGNKKSMEAYEHLLISWQSHELPTPDQALEAVQITLKNIGCDNAQAKWALHQDTNNMHVHLVVVRKDLMNDLAVIRPAFIVNKLHKACAEIVHKQGWERITGQIYEYAEGVGAIEIKDRSQAIDKPRNNQKADDMEAHTGEESAKTKAQRMVAPMLKNAKDWQSLHAELVDNGLYMKRESGGFNLYGFDAPVKFSAINRDYSASKMEARLGKFELAQQQPAHQIAERVVVESPTTLAPDSEAKTYTPDPRYAEYSAAKFEYNNDRQAQVKAFRERQERERSELIKKAKDERSDLAKNYTYYKVSNPSISVTFNAFKSVLAAQQAQEKAELQERQRIEREQFFKNLPYFPRWKEWLQGMNIEQVKQQQQREFMYINGDQYKQPEPLDIRSFKYEAVGDSVYYRSQKDDPAFIDKGKEIAINSWRDESTRRASIQLSITKWGSFVVTGSDEYKLAMVKTAVEMGVASNLANPELQDVIKAEQERFNLEQERLKEMTKQQQAFEKYAKAVDADGYRVVAVKLGENGESRAFFFGDKDINGKPEAMSYDKVMRQIPRFAKWEADKGDNIYYAPVSADKHHILIDDMDKPKLDALIKDGFKPAVLIESSPGNYQAIITITKQSDDSRINSKVENRLIEQLNQKYGNAKLQGLLHPHRASAFHNLEFKHQRDDGSYPEVNLRNHEQRQCSVMTQLAIGMIADLQKDLVKQQAQQQLRTKANIVIRGSIDQAYHFFNNEVKKRFGDDQSKADVMVATRLGAMGFSQSEVANAIAANSPLVRSATEANKYKWDKYGDRAAQVAFISDAYIMLDYSKNYLKLWEKQLGWAAPEPTKKVEREQYYGQGMGR
jgi:hypothetical protein